MQYQSPYTLLSSFLNESEDISKIPLSVLKKRIFAEFELSGKTTIETNFGEFTKNDIIQLFENLSDENYLKIHKTIAQYPDLNEFLCFQTLTSSLNFNDEIYQNNEFIQYISPYLAHSLGTYYAKCMHDTNINIQRVVGIRFPILKEDRKYCIRPISRELNKIKSKLEEQISKSGILQIVDNNLFKHCFRFEVLKVLSLLPKDMFSPVVDDFVNTSINYIYKFYNPFSPNKIKFTDLNGVKAIYEKIKNLSLSRAVIDRIIQLENQMQPVEKEVKEGAGVYSIVRIVVYVFAVFFFSRIFSDHSSKSFNKNIPFEFQQLMNEQLERRNRLQQQNQDSSIFVPNNMDEVVVKTKRVKKTSDTSKHKIIKNNQDSAKLTNEEQENQLKEKLLRIKQSLDSIKNSQ